MSKTIQHFKNGDFVKARDTKGYSVDDLSSEWAGQITEIYQDDKECHVLLDAPSINSLSDTYLLECIEERIVPSECVFQFDQIELINRRDTEYELIESFEKLNKRIEDLLVATDSGSESESENEDPKEKWIQEFSQSSFFSEMTTYQKENAEFVITSFIDFMYNYEYVQSADWNSSNVTSNCLDTIPRKVSAETEFFENYGDVLIKFFSFLGDENYIKNSKSLIQAIKKIKLKIPKEANKTQNWGMAKSMVMGAQDSGIDFTNEEDLASFFSDYNLDSFDHEHTAKIIPLTLNPYRGIGRNQKVSVRYKNGETVENIKFKKVEKDLKSGNCDLIKE